MSNAKQFEKTWHCNERGWRTNTTLRLRNPIMDSFREFGLHPPLKETPPNEQGVVGMASDTLMELSENQAAEPQVYQTDSTWTYRESMDDSASIFSGSLFPRFRRNVEVWVPKKSRLGQ